MDTILDEMLLDPPLAARAADLAGGLRVLRAIPHIKRRTVGPIVFLDQMGPAQLAAPGLAVLSHPHIGLSTVTYLLDGEIEHRDSLGVVQRILPGAVNWMTAGSGIVHVERSIPGPAQAPVNLLGIQLWVALPKSHEDMPPEFHHHGEPSIPLMEEAGVRLRLLAGELEGVRSPVHTHSPLLYAHASMAPASALRFPAVHEERAIYVVSGRVELAQGVVEPGQLAVLKPGVQVVLRSAAGAQVFLLGGEPLDGPRHLLWNFVASSRDRLEAAKLQWQQERFPRVPGETQYIPFPGDGAGLRTYT